MAARDCDTNQTGARKILAAWPAGDAVMAKSQNFFWFFDNDDLRRLRVVSRARVAPKDITGRFERWN